MTKKTAQKKTAAKKAAKKTAPPPRHAAPLALALPALPSMPTLTSLQAIGNAEHAADECAGRARQLRLAATSLQDKADALAVEVRATNLSNDCAQIEIDINAANVHVDRIDAATLTTLGALAAQLDRSIVASQMLNAVLSGVATILDSVVTVKDILADPSLQ